MRPSPVFISFSNILYIYHWSFYIAPVIFLAKVRLARCSHRAQAFLCVSNINILVILLVIFIHVVCRLLIIIESPFIFFLFLFAFRHIRLFLVTFFFLFLPVPKGHVISNLISPDVYLVCSRLRRLAVSDFPS